jgi:hypothetical protein
VACNGSQKISAVHASGEHKTIKSRKNYHAKARNNVVSYLLVHEKQGIS